jgi:hypothetical protein
MVEVERESACISFCGTEKVLSLFPVMIKSHSLFEYSQVFIESITSRQVRLDNRMKKPPKSCQSLVVRLSNAVQSLSNPQVSNVVSISQAKTCP